MVEFKKVWGERILIDPSEIVSITESTLFKEESTIIRTKNDGEFSVEGSYDKTVAALKNAPPITDYKIDYN